MPNPDKGHGDDVDVVVATPSNVSQTFAVNLHERVDKLARDAVKQFVSENLMADLACGLALVENGVATPLDDAARLQEVGVRAEARLVLVVKKPKTDG